MNKGILKYFEALLNDYLESEKHHTLGIPTMNYFTESLNMFANYFGDLFKRRW